MYQNRSIIEIIDRQRHIHSHTHTLLQNRVNLPERPITAWRACYIYKYYTLDIKSTLINTKKPVDPNLSRYFWFNYPKKNLLKYRISWLGSISISKHFMVYQLINFSEFYVRKSS